MKIRETTVEYTVNGIRQNGFTLSEECPVAILYIENEDIANQKAEGLTKRAATIELLKRSIETYFETGYETIDELEKLDPRAAKEIRVDLGLEEYAQLDEDEVYLGNGVYCTPNALLPNGKPVAVPDLQQAR